MVIDSGSKNKQQALSKYRQALDELELQKVQLELPLNAPNDDFKSQLKENLKTAWIELTEDSEPSPIRVLPDAAGQRLDLSSIHLSTSDILKLTDTKKSGFNVNAKEFIPMAMCMPENLCPQIKSKPLVRHQRSQLSLRPQLQVSQHQNPLVRERILQPKERLNLQ